MSRIRSCVMPLALLAMAACDAPRDTGTRAQAAAPFSGEGDGQVTAGDEAAAVADLHVMAAWARAVPPNAPVAGGFMRLHNTGTADDRLISASSTAADRVEIHEVRHEDGMARMRELADGLPLPAGKTVELKPGGYHLMFIGPDPRTFQPGQRAEAMLVFEKAGVKVVGLEVRAPGATAHAPHERQ